jgi:hypothetical protein
MLFFELYQSRREAFTIDRISVQYNWNKLELYQLEARPISANQTVPVLY